MGFPKQEYWSGLPFPCSGVLHSMGKEMATHSPVFLPGESHGQKNLTGYSLWGRKSQMRLSDDTTTTTIRIGEGNATHCRILAWRIPWTEEPGGPPSTGSQRVRGSRFRFSPCHLGPRSRFPALSVSPTQENAPKARNGRERTIRMTSRNVFFMLPSCPALSPGDNHLS